MVIKVPVKHFFKDKNLEKFQDDVDVAFEVLSKIPFLDGILLKDLSLSTTATNFPHKLGRKWVGYLITKKDDNARISYQGIDNNEIYIKLISSIDVLVDVWVF